MYNKTHLLTPNSVQKRRDLAYINNVALRRKRLEQLHSLTEQSESVPQVPDGAVFEGMRFEKGAVSGIHFVVCMDLLIHCFVWKLCILRCFWYLDP